MSDESFPDQQRMRIVPSAPGQLSASLTTARRLTTVPCTTPSTCIQLFPHHERDPAPPLVPTTAFSNSSSQSHPPISPAYHRPKSIYSKLYNHPSAALPVSQPPNTSLALVCHPRAAALPASEPLNGQGAHLPLLASSLPRNHKPTRILLVSLKFGASSAPHSTAQLQRPDLIRSSLSLSTTGKLHTNVQRTVAILRCKCCAVPSPRDGTFFVRPAPCGKRLYPWLRAVDALLFIASPLNSMRYRPSAQVQERGHFGPRKKRCYR